MLKPIQRRFLGYMLAAAAFIWVAVEFFAADPGLILEYLLLTLALLAGLILLAMALVMGLRWLVKRISSGS